MGERANEWMSAAERVSGARKWSEQCGESEWVCGASEWASGRVNGPVQDASFFNGSDPISWPKIGSEKRTGPIAMKIGMHDPHNNIIKVIKAFSEIRALAWDTGPQWGCPSRAQNCKNCFFNFFYFFCLFTRMFLNYEKPPYSKKNSFLVDLASEIILSPLISHTKKGGKIMKNCEYFR